MFCASMQGQGCSGAASPTALWVTASEQALTSVPELDGICAFLMSATLTSFTTGATATDLALSAIFCKFLSLILLHFPSYALKIEKLSLLRFWQFEGYFFSLSDFHCLGMTVCNCGEADQRTELSSFSCLQDGTS